MFTKSISHAVQVALAGLAIVILQAITPALQSYHPQGLIATIVCNSIIPIIIAAIAGLIHFFQTQEGVDAGKIVPVLLAFLLLAGGNGFAQSTTVTNTPPVSITQTVDNALQAVNVPVQIAKIQTSGLAIESGFFYNIRDKVLEDSFSYAPFGGKEIGNFATWDYAMLGYANPNVLILGTGVSFNAGALASDMKMTFSPAITSVLASTSFGLAPTFGIENVGGTNRTTEGVNFYGKITF